MRHRTQFAWRPIKSSAFVNVRCFISTVRLQTDFGAAEPAQRPRRSLKNLLYLTEPADRKGLFKRYVHLAHGQMRYIGAATFGVCLYSFSTLSIPACFGLLIDHASHGQLPIGTSMQLLGLFALGAVGNYLRVYYIGVAGERIIQALRRRLYSSIIHQPTKFFDSPENRTGALVQRISMDCNVIGCSLTEAVTCGSKNLLQTAGSLGVMLYFSPLLTLVTVGMVPPVAIFAALYGRYVRKLQHNMQDAIAEMGTVAEERLSHIRTVKAFGTATQEEAWFSQKVERVFDLSVLMLRWNASFVAGLQASGYGAMYGIVWAGATLVAGNHLTTGTMFSFMLYTIYCGVGFIGLTNLVTEINKGYGASLRMFDLLDKAEAATAEQASTKQLTPAIKCWGASFKDVDFAYPSRPEVNVFKSLNLTIESSRCTCVVSSSGTGKSTIALLLLKLYEPSSGTIQLDGYDIHDIKTQWLHEQIGFVGQEPVLFAGTVAQNIAYGIPGRNWSDPIDRWLYNSIVEASTQANAHHFISSLPDGYDTFVGESGRSLSGGQKQRIAIARALVRNPQLIVFDEATSALDSESEKIVHEAIFRLIDKSKNKDTASSQRTVILFAHKLSMISRADHIVVLHQGKVYEQGSFEKVSQNELFRQLVGLSTEHRTSSLLSQDNFSQEKQ